MIGYDLRVMVHGNVPVLVLDRGIDGVTRGDLFMVLFTLSLMMV